MRPIDADRITADSEFVRATVGLFKSCKMKHHEGCWAPTCEDCFARAFSSFNLLPFSEELSCDARMNSEENVNE